LKVENGFCFLVTAFSKKTGDYGALSATDLKVLALTYMLEVRHVGSEDHLAKVPTMSKTVEFYKPGSDIASDNAKVIAGFYHPGGVGDPEISENLEIVKSPENPEMDIDQDQDKDDSDEGIEDSASDEEDSDEGWITPSNFKVNKTFEKSQHLLQIKNIKN
jgi:RNA-binding protein NOB1